MATLILIGLGSLISRLRLENFKAFDRAFLDLAPLTLILGPNNSGKSSLLAPIRLLSQTIDSYDSDVPLLLNGVMGDFGTYKDLVHGNHRGRPFRITLTTAVDENEVRYGPPPGSSVQLDLEFKHRTKRRETILRSATISMDGNQVLEVEYSTDSNRHSISRIGDQVVPPHIKGVLARHLKMRHFLPSIFIGSAVRGEGSAVEAFLDSDTSGRIRIGTQLAGYLWRQFGRIEYVGATREPPQRTYLFSGEKRRRVGSSGEYAASLFMLDSVRSGKARLGLQGLVSGWLSRAGIADRMFVEVISDRHYEIRVSHPITEENENFSDVGYGNSQIFPVLVGGYSAEAGTTYLVEEPEIHLHPRAQAELAGFFVELHERGVQSLVETHSEYLVVRLQRLVAEGRVSPDAVKFYYVSATETGKRLTELELDPVGRFRQEWPEGFFPERLREAKDLSKARASRGRQEAS